jgi:hypothetical protein
MDISSKWLRHIGEAFKLTCQYCTEKKIFSSEEARTAHILELHPEKLLKEELHTGYVPASIPFLKP